MAFLQELKDAFNPAKPSKFKKLREQPAAELPDAYESKMEDLPAHVRKDVRRYLHIFNNDITPVLKYMDELTTVGKSDIENFTKLMSEEDKMIEHLMGYLKKYPWLGLVYLIPLDDAKHQRLCETSKCDADLSGDSFDAKSTSAPSDKKQLFGVPALGVIQKFENFRVSFRKGTLALHREASQFSQAAFSAHDTTDFPYFEKTCSFLG